MEPTKTTPAQAQALRRRLMERVADEDTSAHLTVAGATAPGPDWQPWLPGVKLRLLHAAPGHSSFLLQLAPGAELPAHRHRADEECLVLEGELQVGKHLRLGPGSWHLARAGALHTRIQAPHGALVYLRAPLPEIDDVLS